MVKKETLKWWLLLLDIQNSWRELYHIVISLFQALGQCSVQRNMTWVNEITTTDLPPVPLILSFARFACVIFLRGLHWLGAWNRLHCHRIIFSSINGIREYVGHSSQISIRNQHSRRTKPPPGSKYRIYWNKCYGAYPIFSHLKCST